MFLQEVVVVQNRVIIKSVSGLIAGETFVGSNIKAAVSNGGANGEKVTTSSICAV